MIVHKTAPAFEWKAAIEDHPNMVAGCIGGGGLVGAGLFAASSDNKASVRAQYAPLNPSPAHGAAALQGAATGLVFGTGVGALAAYFLCKPTVTLSSMSASHLHHHIHARS